MTHPIPGADSERALPPLPKPLGIIEYAVKGEQINRVCDGFGSDQMADYVRADRAAAKVGANVAADEGAISAAMSEGNKHGVKSFVAAKIVAAYLAAGTPAETPKPAAAAQMPTDDEVWEKCISVKPESFEQGPDDAMDFKKYDAAVVRAYLAAQPAPAPKNRSE